MQRSDRVVISALDPGERVLWSGRPAQGFIFTAKDFFTIPAGLLFTVVGVLMATGWHFELSPTQKTWPLVVALFAIPHIAIGLYVLAGRHFLDRAYRAGLHYAITDSRVLIIATALSKRIQSLDFSAIRPLQLDQFPGGTGTIYLTNEHTSRGEHSQSFSSQETLGSPPLFFRIKDAKRAYDILMDVSSRPSKKASRY